MQLKTADDFIRISYWLRFDTILLLIDLFYKCTLVRNFRKCFGTVTDRNYAVIYLISGFQQGRSIRCLHTTWAKNVTIWLTNVQSLCSTSWLSNRANSSNLPTVITLPVNFCIDTIYSNKILTQLIIIINEILCILVELVLTYVYDLDIYAFIKESKWF